MNHLLEVCLVALTLTTGITPSIAAQSPGAMQKGISVELPLTGNAVPMPDADPEDSLIVNFTADGRVYFGVNPISPAAFTEKIKGGLSDRTEKKLYVKADARTPYANVVNVLDAMRTAGVEAPNLLTAQQDSSEPGTLVPPKGLEVLVGPPLPSGSDAIVVQALNWGSNGPRKCACPPAPTLVASSSQKLFVPSGKTLTELLGQQREPARASGERLTHLEFQSQPQ